MMVLKSRKHLFNLFGGGVVVLWLVLIGVLVRNVNSKGESEHSGAIQGAVSVITSLQREWMEIYLKGQKVGYSMTQINPVGEDYLIREEILLNLNLMGQPTSIFMNTRSIVDQRFLLRKFNFNMKSGAVSYKISGTVNGNFMQLEIGEGKAKRSERIGLSDSPMIGSGLGAYFKGRRIEVGQSFKFPIFDPSTMALKELVVKVAERETLLIRRFEYRTFRLEAEMLGQPMTFWVDESGTVLKEKSVMGLTLIRSSAAMAPQGIQGSGGSDFYELAAINVKGRLRDPAKLTYLSLKVKGIAGEHFDTAIFNKGRQRYHSGIIEVVQEEIPTKAGYILPFEDRSGKMALFLKPEFNIESDNEGIVKKARDIAGNIRDPSSVAKKLMTWVHQNVEKRPVISVPSALEVLKNRVGDCNEHAALLTGLLRASGIPARVCVGIVYARGRFYYHAWTEGYLGRWVSMDAALNQMPADATHVKLVEGGLDRQVDIIGLIGKIKLEVVDYRYD
jgi:hypothetical protein